jgi:glycogenin glucosyltransferase
MLTDGVEYARSAVKLLASIKRNTNRSFDAIIIILAKRPAIKPVLRAELAKAGWQFCKLDRIAPRDEKNTFPRFRDQFTKLQLWRMVEYDSVIYFDSDTYVIRNINYLFTVHEQLSYESETGKYRIGVTKDIRDGLWQSTFNMGVFVIKPNTTEYERLVKLKDDTNFKFETAMSEQGFLNVLYKDMWLEIGFEYNANLAVYSQQRKYWDERERNISVIHYTMNKPWECGAEYKPVCNLWGSYRIF